MEEYIYVLNKNREPLMPTKRKAKVRILLKQKKARIVNHKPFTIQLLYETENQVQPVQIAIDPGRTNIGIAVLNEKGTVVYAAKVSTRNKEVPKLMQERKVHRQTSRQGERKCRQRRAIQQETTFKEGTEKERVLPQCESPIKIKYIKNTEAKYCNRKRPERWLTPTATHLLRTMQNVIKLAQTILPICHCSIEYNRFAFLELENPNLKKWEYSKGQLYQEKNVKSYIQKKQNGKCIFCNEKIAHYHHIVPRSQGGSNTVKNLVGLCEKHHKLVHTDRSYEMKLKAKKAGLSKQYGGTSILNTIMPYLAEELETLFDGHVFFCEGATTKAIREKYGLRKDHHLDAYCIGLAYLDSLGRKPLSIETDIIPYEIKQYRRHNRQLIHKQSERTYKLDGQVVAKNRTKRMGQTEPSLRDWYQANKRTLGKTETKCLQSQFKVLKSKRSYRNPDTILPGAIFLHQGKRYVLSGTANQGRYYRAVGEGTKNFKVKDCKLVKYNQGFVYL